MQFNVKIPSNHSILLIFGLLLMLSATSACRNQADIATYSEFPKPVSASVTGRTAQAPSERDRVPGHSPKSPLDRSVKVFFPQTPDGDTQIGEVEPVWRSTDRIDGAEFAIEQLIAGPTPEERERGLRDEILLTGESNCGGENFTLSISDAAEARLQFCRGVISAGIGQDVRIRNAIESTLQQFSTVEKVIILNQYGDCFKDLSGENLCLVEED